MLSWFLGGGGADGAGAAGSAEGGGGQDDAAAAAAATAEREHAVREKRLARFGATAAAPSVAAPASAAPAAASGGETKSGSRDAANAAVAATATPTPPPAAGISDAATAPATTAATAPPANGPAAAVPPPAAPRTSTSSSSSSSSFSSSSSADPHALIQKALHVTLVKPAPPSSRDGRDPPPPTFLPSITDARLGAHNLQETVRARLGHGGKPPLAWLVASLGRVDALRHQRRHHLPEVAAPTADLLDTLETVLSNWLVTMLEMDMFPPARPHATLLHELVALLLRGRAAFAVAALTRCGPDGGFALLRTVLHRLTVDAASPLRSLNGRPPPPQQQALAHMQQAQQPGAFPVVVRESGPFMAVHAAVAELSRGKEAMAEVFFKCPGWSLTDVEDDHNSDDDMLYGDGPGARGNTGARLEHRTVLGLLLRAGVDGHPSCLPDALFSPPADTDVDASSRQQLEQRQLAWALGASGSMLPAVQDPNVVRFGNRRELFRDPRQMFGVNDVLVAEALFPMPGVPWLNGQARLTRSQLQAGKERVARPLTLAWEATHRLVMRALKNKTLRPRMVAWLSEAVALLSSRARTVRSACREASDAFAVSLCAVLLRACQPIMKNDQGKWPLLGKVRSATDFFFPGFADAALLAKGVFPAAGMEMLHHGGGGSGGAGDGGGSTDVGATAAAAGAAAEVNFVTQCFFLTARCFHLSVAQATASLVSLSCPRALHTFNTCMLPVCICQPCFTHHSCDFHGPTVPDGPHSPPGATRGFS